MSKTVDSSVADFWIPILLYHRVVPKIPNGDLAGICISAAAFESQIRWLAARRYVGVPLDAVERELRAERGAPRALPPRSVAITFDDGYLDNYLYAWPILKRFGFNATIFMVTDAIGGDNGFDTACGGERTKMLSTAEIREMHRQHIDFGSHSCTHPNTLVALSDDRLKLELERSRGVLEDTLGAPVRYFAYPHSKHDARVEEAVERAGYSLACSGVGTRFAPFCLKRVKPPAHRGPAIEAQIRWQQLKWLGKRRLLRSTDNESGER